MPRFKLFRKISKLQKQKRGERMKMCVKRWRILANFWIPENNQKENLQPQRTEYKAEILII
jgi:hypothetical protein